MLVSISLTPSILETSLDFGGETKPLVDYRIAKRLSDVAGGLSLLVALAPVMLVVAMLVKLGSRGPAIYSQTRLTIGGKKFTMYKFRTMCQGAESESGAVFAADNDPRVTKLGRLLRASRLDELPQIFNVLSGEMSLIGPRPERPEMALELAEFFPAFNQRLQVKAGLTGLAQIHHGYADSIDTYRDKLKWDLEYVERKSVLLDVLIALRTVPVVLTGYGAK